MKISAFKNNWLTAAGLLLALPTAFFILISVLKYGFGIDGPFDAVWPMLESLGAKESIGWNINLLILFGPVLAILFTIFQVLSIEWHFTKEEFMMHLTIQKRWFPLVVGAFGVALLAILLFYLLGENCNC